MAAQFDSNDEWPGYFSKHKATDHCFSCHEKPDCLVTVITFDGEPAVEVTVRGKVKQLTEDDQARIIQNATAARKELEALLKTL